MNFGYEVGQLNLDQTCFWTHDHTPPSPPNTVTVQCTAQDTLQWGSNVIVLSKKYCLNKLVPYNITHIKT